MTNSDTLVSVENVSKKFCRRLKRSLFYGAMEIAGELCGRNANTQLRKDEFWALRGVSFKVHRGEALGLIGPNGAGKTTILRMINGLLKPNEGRIEIRGRMLALIALGAGFNPILTGRENVYVNAAVLGLSKTDTEKYFDDIVSFSGIENFIDSPVQSYSSGMQVRLGFAVAVHFDPDILLVDEVLAVGDLGFQSRCLNKIGELRAAGTGIILVSHNTHTISTHTSRVIVLNEGKHTSFDDVNEGIREYRRIFTSAGRTEIQKVCSGNELIDFRNVRIPYRSLRPRDSFVLELNYQSTRSFRNVEVDLGIYSSNEPNLHFQATNLAYGVSVDLHEGEHCLRITIHELPINGASALISCCIWTEHRSEHLFWWRIPVSFEAVDFSSGNNFVNVTYEHVNQDVRSFTEAH